MTLHPRESVHACDCSSTLHVGARVMWNTGADDATGEVIAAPPIGELQVRRDDRQRNGGAIYWLAPSRLWAITDPPYQERPR